MCKYCRPVCVCAIDDIITSSYFTSFLLLEVIIASLHQETRAHTLSLKRVRIHTVLKGPSHKEAHKTPTIAHVTHTWRRMYKQYESQ